jgi:UDP-glucose 4-epimerase
VKILVTGSTGHLGEALVRTLQDAGHTVVGVDILASPTTHVVGSIADRNVVKSCMAGVHAVMHTATLHKPHVATHSKQDFVDTNITGTLHLLEEAVRAGVGAFVFTSTTSAFGRALSPAPGEPAAWITEDVVPVPKNIYGVTKLAAENLCELFAHKQSLPCLVLRTSRFFPEADDNPDTRAAFDDSNTKANELLYRRVDIEDIVSAHVLAMHKLLAAPPATAATNFARYIISATTPFDPSDLAQLRSDAPSVLARYFADYSQLYAKQGWAMFDSIDRVYVNDRARATLGWQPRYDFAHVLACLREGVDYRSPLAMAVGRKGYHAQVFEDEPFPVD